MEPSKRQQIVIVRATTIHATIPTIVPAVAPKNPTPTKPYAGSLPKCKKCNFHHTGNCPEMQCCNCNRKAHTARFCRTPPQPLNQVPAAGVGRACYQCGDVGHFKRDCPNVGNAGGVGRILALGHEEAMADPAVVTHTFLLNNTYACILFDCGAERSFMSQNFKHILNQNSQQLNETLTV
ncbi:uncharacterized protein LOC111884852 [Lactuca sativa]|uniref:uncharacterized protein LOC111884852 n=1 Tax=Lactuca sativa TaxID=4236 RepID=UPI000CD83047|nr:uncharacterized protein LOC111884852 [Lactuca sativa]